MPEDKNKHTLLKIAGGLALTGAAAYSGFSYIIFRNSFDLEHSIIYQQKNIVHTNSEQEEWFSHSSKQDIYLKSFDGLRLHGCFIHNHEDSHKYIILVHGISSYYKNMITYMYEADYRGFNILAIDQRGAGESEGKYTSLGWNEHYDLINWINDLTTKDREAQIVLLGVNVGAVTVMNALGDYLCANVKCAVVDGGFSDMSEIINYSTRSITKVEAKPFMKGVDTLVRQLLHFSLEDVSIHRQLKQCEVPVQFVHGSEDSTVPTSMVFDNYYACASEKELYIVEGKGYNETQNAPDYFQTIFSFIEKYVS